MIYSWIAKLCIIGLCILWVHIFLNVMDLKPFCKKWIIFEITHIFVGGTIGCCISDYIHNFMIY